MSSRNSPLSGSISVGSVSTLTFSVDNTANVVAATALDFTNNLPAGVVLATPVNAAATCIGGTLTAIQGTAVISYTGGTVFGASFGVSSSDVFTVETSSETEYAAQVGDIVFWGYGIWPGIGVTLGLTATYYVLLVQGVAPSRAATLDARWSPVASRQTAVYAIAWPHSQNKRTWRSATRRSDCARTTLP